MSCKLHYDSTECPHCGANLIGSEIPEKDREAFGGKTHFSRLIGVERLGDDYISWWQCPDCGASDGEVKALRVGGLYEIQ